MQEQILLDPKVAKKLLHWYHLDSPKILSILLTLLISNKEKVLAICQILDIVFILEI